MREALAQAHDGRLFILDKMKGAISQTTTDISPFAPRITKISINPDRIRDIIGPGGKMIRKLTEETKCTIDIEDDGTVLIGSTSSENAEKAIAMIKGLTRDVEVGTVYKGKVSRIMAFGAFVEILPGKEGLVHISELADYRVPSVEDVVQVGDEIEVLVIEIDRQGRINLSRRALLTGGETGGEAPREPRPLGAGADRGGPPPRSGPRPERDGGSRPPFRDRPPLRREGGDRPPFRGPRPAGPRPEPRFDEGPGTPD
jgi:polyribonucleotide nucleotidyltransferase